jgi:hypothetical protein
MEKMKPMHNFRIIKPALPAVLITVLFLMNFTVLQAQTVGNNKVIITRGFTPTLNDASKIKTNPSIPDTVYQNPKFEYAITDVTIEPPFKVNNIKAAKMKGEPLTKLYHDYVAIGFGNYSTPFFEFYHSNLRSRDKKFGVHAKHFSSAGSIPDYAYPGFSNNLLETYFTKIYKKSFLTVEGKYQRDVVHRYGFEPAQFPDSLLPSDNDIRNVYNLGEFKMQWKRYRKRPKDMDYDIRLNYHYLSDDYNTAENVVDFKSGMDWRINMINMLTEQRLGGELEYHFYNNSFDSMDTRNSSLIRLKPLYKFRYRTLLVELGISSDVVVDSVTDAHFYPQLDMKLEAISKILYFNFSIAGGMRKNTLKSYSDENPFIGNKLPMDFTNYKYLVNFGLGSTISRELDFNLQLHYNRLEHAPLYVTDFSTLYDNTFKVVYDDYDELRLHAGFAWQKQEKLRFMLMTDFYVYNMTNELYAWHKPNYVITFSTNYNIGDKILLKAELFGYGPSKAPVEVNGTMNPQTVKGFLDANIGIEYRYRKRLGIFLKINNIAASRYYRYYNYPSYRFNILGGISYIF